LTEAGPTRGWRRSRRGKAAAAALVTLAVYAAVEVGLRLFLGPPPPPVRVFSEHRPVETYLVQVGDQVQARYDGEAGIPDFDATPRGRRVAVLGGSSARGGTRGLALDGEFPALLGAALGVEVLNLANPSRDSHDVRRLAGELLESWPPDVLVVYTGHNDFSNTFFHERYAGYAGGARAWATALAERSQIYVQLRRLRAGWTGKLGAAPRLGRSQLQVAAPLTGDQLWTTLRYLDANLRRVAWLCRRQGVPLVLCTPASRLVTQPVNPSCDVQPCAMERFEGALAVQDSDPAAAVRLLREARDLDTVPLRAPTFATDLIREIARGEAGVTLVDAEADLPRHPGLDVAGEHLFEDPVHFSAAGHRAMAELLAPAVRSALAGDP